MMNTLQRQLQQQLQYSPDDYMWVNLGIIGYGVNNDEGYSKIFAKVGILNIDNDNFHFSKKPDLIHCSIKYYFGHQTVCHHIDEVTFEYNDLTKIIKFFKTSKKELSPREEDK